MCSTFASELLRDLEDDCQLVISILAAHRNNVRNDELHVTARRPYLVIFAIHSKSSLRA